MKKSYYDDKKDLGNNEIFNFLWFSFFLFSLIIAAKHIAYFPSEWEGYFLGIFSIIMLFDQFRRTWNMIRYLRGK